LREGGREGGEVSGGDRRMTETCAIERQGRRRIDLRRMTKNTKPPSFHPSLHPSLPPSLLLNLQPNSKQAIVSDNQKLDADEDAGAGRVEVEERRRIHL